jgi:hypothetical protein
MSFVFISHRSLDRLLATGIASLEHDRLTMANEPTLEWKMEPAVYFSSLDNGVAGGEELVGRVKTSSELDGLGADHFGTAVLIGEYSFTVKPGYVGRCAQKGGVARPMDHALIASLLAVEAQLSHN